MSIGMEIMRPSRRPMRRNLPANGRSMSASENAASLLTRSPLDLSASCAPGRMASGLANAWVWGIFMVRVPAVVPAPAAMEAGEKTYEAPCGNPLAVSVTLLTKLLLSGATLKLTVAEPPDDPVAEGDEMLMLKSVGNRPYTAICPGVLLVAT